MSMCCKDSVFITKFQAYQGMKSQNSKVFKRVYHKIPSFFWSGITKFRIMNRRAIESTVFKITLGKHIVGKGFKFLERHVFHGTFYLSYQFVTFVVVVVIETMGECCHDLMSIVYNIMLYLFI